MKWWIQANLIQHKFCQQNFPWQWNVKELKRLSNKSFQCNYFSGALLQRKYMPPPRVSSEVCQEELVIFIWKVCERENFHCINLKSFICFHFNGKWIFFFCFSDFIKVYLSPNFTLNYKCKCWALIFLRQLFFNANFWYY